MLDPLQIIVSLLLGSSVFLLVWALFRFPVETAPPVHRRIALAVGEGKRRTLFEQRWLAPVMHLMLALARRLNIPALRGSVRRNLDASGNPSGYSVEEYIAICLISAIGTGAAAGVIGLVVIERLDPLLIVALGVIGFAGPIFALRSAARSRTQRISRQLPYSLDLTALMMAAGSTFTEAVETIIRDDPENDLNQELAIVLAEIGYGTHRATALQNLAARIPQDTLRSVVGAINQAETLGTPLSLILKTQADIMRMHRSVRAEKLSASASLRILVPTMLILIAVVLIMFGPLIMRWYMGDMMF